MTLTLNQIYDKHLEGGYPPGIVYLSQNAFLDLRGWKRTRFGWYHKGTIRARRIAALRLEGVDVKDPAIPIRMTKTAAG